MRRLLVLGLCAVGGSALAAESNFAAFLDGKPIGEHRFVVGGPAEAREVLSDARFNVKLLGLTVYRYRHQATERWRGDCLDSLSASTDDDGTLSRVRTEPAGEGLSVLTETGVGTAPVARSLPGCVMSFAYWNPAMRSQSRLLNAQTGKAEAVRVSRIGSAPIEVRGRSLTATRWRIEGPPQPIDVWYSAQGEWVGLDSTLEGGRLLTYRLK
ncbi:DUF6134 family protein [Variovorax sp. UMC13]|uniref:DUF6134 family protein n=1 Tax=Variovorax sp. UMC13 TaxID=1862326 RepID=UPI001602E88C|nr:DUF6134 family protein [Variovorax sp. UMC13]MBB1602050.1 hypothetical protein [Variovorax sp. UMC13]